MNWEYWREMFKQYLPSHYVDREIDRYQEIFDVVYPNREEGILALNYMFATVLENIKEARNGVQQQVQGDNSKES